MDNLKQKTIAGLSWSFIDNFLKYGLTLVISIILARQLSPADFGLIGMTTIFFAVSSTFIDSGFSTAIIRKQNPSDIDLSSVFFLNIFIGLVLFIIIFLLAPVIALFFQEPRLIAIIRVISLGIIFGSFSVVQNTIIIKRIDFKKLTKITIIATMTSGTVAVYLAYNGYGVWSLVANNLVAVFSSMLLLWFFSRWRPKFIFSMNAIHELFGFGSKILVSSFINVVFNNLFYLVIGKYFSANELGYYTRADGFRKLPSEQLTSVIQRVSYPVLSSIQEDKPKLKNAYRRLIRNTMFFSFIFMIGMAASAEAMIVVLIGEKWLPSVVYLQLLCFVGMLYPLHAINLNMLFLQGRSDIFLNLEIIKKLLMIPVVLTGIYFGIKSMIILTLITSFLSLYLNSYYSGKGIGYKLIEQIIDILPSFILACTMGLIVFLFGALFYSSPLLKFILQIVIGALFVFFSGEIFKHPDYAYLKRTLIDQLKKQRL